MDKIYRGMLRFGRPEPNYRRTDSSNVVLKLATVDADEAFLKLVVEQEGKLKRELPIDSLIALAALRELKRLTTEELALNIQREPAQAKRTLGWSSAECVQALVQTDCSPCAVRAFMRSVADFLVLHREVSWDRGRRAPVSASNAVNVATAPSPVVA